MLKAPTLAALGGVFPEREDTKNLFHFPSTATEQKAILWLHTLRECNGAWKLASATRSLFCTQEGVFRQGLRVAMSSQISSLSYQPDVVELP